MQVGQDAHANLVRNALVSAGVHLDHVNTVDAPTGHAVVILQPGGKNSIIIVGGANVAWPKLEDGISSLTTNAQELIKRAGAVLLQREIPDAVNLEAAKVESSTRAVVHSSSYSITTQNPMKHLYKIENDHPFPYDFFTVKRHFSSKFEHNFYYHIPACRLLRVPVFL